MTVVGRPGSVGTKVRRGGLGVRGVVRGRIASMGRDLVPVRTGVLDVEILLLLVILLALLLVAAVAIIVGEGREGCIIAADAAVNARVIVHEEVAKVKASSVDFTEAQSLRSSRLTTSGHSTSLINGLQSLEPVVNFLLGATNSGSDLLPGLILTLHLLDHSVLQRSPGDIVILATFNGGRGSLWIILHLIIALIADEVAILARAFVTLATTVGAEGTINRL